MIGHGRARALIVGKGESLKEASWRTIHMNVPTW